LISITADQVTPEILSLFDITRPTMPRAFNVLEGMNRGQILVNDSARPAWAVVHEVTYGTLYIGGQVDASVLESLVYRIRQVSDVGIGCWLDDPLNHMLPPKPDYDGRTLYFTERSRSSSASQTALPKEYSVVMRDQQLLKRSPDYKSTLDSFGTEEKILQNTFGVLILHGDELACEAASGASTQGLIEVGVMTAESHRQRGLATIACSHLIEMCESLGFKTWWDCAKQNIASTKLARKLGYQDEREYRYVWWSGNRA
jgi:RimJ/RimL family protein N-acetyltransferase